MLLHCCLCLAHGSASHATSVGDDHHHSRHGSFVRGLIMLFRFRLFDVLGFFSLLHYYGEEKGNSVALKLQVLPYGSIPFKTFFLDEDINVTTLSCQNIEDNLILDIPVVLYGEEINETVEYEVKSVCFIVVEVDVKPSIIQIKAWCYDESLLGSQHGLISTYTFENFGSYFPSIPSILR